MPLPADAEPAVRDPKKLNRTAWTLVAIMIAGGWLTDMIGALVWAAAWIHQSRVIKLGDLAKGRSD